MKPQLFDDRCTTVPNRLRLGSSLKNDGMAHLDRFGYGDFYRATLFVQVKLISQTYTHSLSADRLELLKSFLDAFKGYRPRQHRKAQRILQSFRENDVQTTDGHAKILIELTEMEKLDQFMGISSYCEHNGKFILP